MRAPLWLDLDGAVNARDLGGLPTVDGGETAFGVVVRADALAGLMPTGWAAAHAHGIRTVVDLLGPDQRRADTRARLAALGHDDNPRIEEILVTNGTTNRAEVLSAAASVEVATALRGAGVTDQQLSPVRDRLRPPLPRPPHE